MLNKIEEESVEPTLITYHAGNHELVHKSPIQVQIVA